MGEQQLVLTDYHKRLVEGIPMEEYAQGDPVTGRCLVLRPDPVLWADRVVR